jgi:RNA polymerase sigma factor (TIGR02999 family)
MERSPGEFTDLVARLRNGNKEAEAQLYEAVYQELRRVAAKYLRNERPNHTLQPTALVNEACVKLLGAPAREWNNKEHFFAVAARAMRQVLVDHARERRAEKRGGALTKMQLDDFLPAGNQQSPGVDADRLDEILFVNSAMDRLAEEHPRQSQVVELRFFGGLTAEEASRILGVDMRTVHRDWQFARAWLYRELKDKE